MTIGEKIKTIRKKRGITQLKLAELTGLGIISIQQLEYGKCQPRYGTLKKIAKALKVQPFVLVTDEKEYWEMQYWLTEKLAMKNSDPTRAGKYIEGYEEAILAVKSKLHELYTEGEDL